MEQEGVRETWREEERDSYRERCGRGRGRATARLERERAQAREREREREKRSLLTINK